MQSHNPVTDNHSDSDEFAITDVDYSDVSTLFPQDHNSSNGNVARTNAPDRVVLSLNQDPRTGVHSRPVRACTLKRSHRRSSSGSEDDDFPEGVCL